MDVVFSSFQLYLIPPLFFYLIQPYSSPFLPSSLSFSHSFSSHFHPLNFHPWICTHSPPRSHTLIFSTIRIPQPFHKNPVQSPVLEKRSEEKNQGGERMWRGLVFEVCEEEEKEGGVRWERKRVRFLRGDEMFCYVGIGYFKKEEGRKEGGRRRGRKNGVERERMG